ncbi:MAG TPA: VWA containing CoxE family protein, partial [Thermoanaerobaculia bacterium]
ELLYPRGAIYYYDADDAEPSLAWLERLRDRFRHSVWLNPIPKEDWKVSYGRMTIHKIGEVFPMEDLTIGGIRRAVERLGRS